ncbi:methyltransferase domain-containing protein [Zobellella sp. DQSA1]|uniref:methyltransferase domain-containing protein n=1 Tax=Zobellella sp. DQSA1 TaxID=3342386 RepID=UPI0035C14FA7
MHLMSSTEFNPALFDELKSLRLPSVNGKRFINIGCGEGFFCGYALFDGALESIGVDESEATVQQAKVNFPSGKFISGQSLPEGEARYDVILYSANIHEAEDQQERITSLVSSLNDDGLLVIKFNIYPSKKNEWIKKEKNGRVALFPSKKKFSEMLSSHAWKIIGYGIDQPEKKRNCVIVHIRKMKPFSYLMLATPASGKTTISRALFEKAGIPVVSGDRTYYQIYRGKIPAPSALQELVQKNYSATGIDKVTQLVFSHGLEQELVDIWCSQHGYCDFAIDSYVPEDYHQRIAELLGQKGYVPVQLNWDMNKSMPSGTETEKKASAYQRFVSSQQHEEVEVFVERAILPESLEKNLRWHLDHPYDGKLVTQNLPLKLSGWVCSVEPQQNITHCFIRAFGNSQRYPLNTAREDVVDVLKTELGIQPPSLCGFHCIVEYGTLAAGFEFGFIVRDQEVKIANIKPKAGKTSLLKSVKEKIKAKW